jgi:hypothetical protein
MNEIDFVLAVFLSSGAGYLTGKHYERKRARRAFNNLARCAGEATSKINAIMMHMIHERLPDLDMNKFVKELMNNLKAAGVEAVVENMDTKQEIRADDNATK